MFNICMTELQSTFVLHFLDAKTLSLSLNVLILYNTKIHKDPIKIWIFHKFAYFVTTRTLNKIISVRKKIIKQTFRLLTSHSTIKGTNTHSLKRRSQYRRIDRNTTLRKSCMPLKLVRPTPIYVVGELLLSSTVC